MYSIYSFILLKNLWDAATCGGTLHYQHDEPTSFFSPAHRRLPRRPSLLGGGVAATELDHGIRKDGLKRKKKEADKEGRGERCVPRGQRRSPSAQHAEEEVQPGSRESLDLLLLQTFQNFISFLNFSRCVRDNRPYNPCQQKNADRHNQQSKDMMKRGDERTPRALRAQKMKRLSSLVREESTFRSTVSSAPRVENVKIKKETYVSRLCLSVCLSLCLLACLSVCMLVVPLLGSIF